MLAFQKLIVLVIFCPPNSYWNPVAVKYEAGQLMIWFFVKHPYVFFAG
jgi:hypothetical protein